METASLVLLIVVSATLSVFLVVFAVALVYSIGILKQVKRITSRAENVAGSMEAAASAFEKRAAPLAMLKLISNIVSHAAGSKRKKG